MEAPGFEGGMWEYQLLEALSVFPVVPVGIVTAPDTKASVASEPLWVE